ncbi:MoaB/Mog domain-containing protein [Staphylotrichum tortipilum]|uniref:MoaB/Mog domain-containing protein n=1 Tax=Staphylotrichum tortipilum TaxID=2831512 RepID=A0AAN6MJY7_9PEZI|nr:MoaB/Mog domain-containing protein [Staphylotrichum longicolle]
MFSRASQIARHLSRPLPNLAHSSAAAFRGTMTAGPAAATAASERASRKIHTAACLIIGDEVLGGKACYTNSNYFAKWCFGLGINLKRVEVIEDDEAEIIEAIRRMSERYDMVVTSHDDITYASIAKAFSLPLVQHQQAYELMKKLSKPHPGQPNFSWDEDSPALRARLRMVELPHDASRPADQQALFPCPELWVPIAVVNGNVHILPGVPRLFEQLLKGLTPSILPRLTDPEGKGTVRVSISTPLPESAVADYLTALAARVEPRGVKVGSYPRWGKKRNTVTLVGRDREFLDSITPEVVQAVQGRVMTAEGEEVEE